MLDVHAPPHAAHGWRDFFVHIVTIVVGLLIALGLEQFVEGIHHRREVQEARKAIAEEHTANQREFATATELFRRETKRFQTNLAVLQYLQQHPGAPQDTWPGKINWHNFITTFSTAAWQSAQHLGVTARMSPSDVQQLEHLYDQLRVVQASGADRLRAISAARRYMVSDADPSRLTGPQLTNEIELAEAVLIAHYRFGGDMRNLHSAYPEFAPSPETDELRAIVHEPPMTEEERREIWGH
jgi:type II secretory pathway pseudopilin PulG